MPSAGMVLWNTMGRFGKICGICKKTGVYFSLAYLEKEDLL